MAATVTNPKTEAMVVAGLAGAAGLTLIFLGLRKSPPPGVLPGQRYDALGPLANLQPGEQMGLPAWPTVPQSVAVPSPLSTANPHVPYLGPGRDAYTYARIVQSIGGVLVTVYGSGVAGIHLPAETTLTNVPLVAPNQPQPPTCNGGQPGAFLCLFIFPGCPVPPCTIDNTPTPIWGALPKLGGAWLVLEIYQNQTESGSAADADGFSAPTYAHNGVYRVPIARQIYQNFTIV